MSSTGQFHVDRGIFYDWTAEDRPWDSLSLWLYIISRGQYQDTTVTFLGHQFTLTRGQLVTTESHLCSVAGWTRKRLRTFLDHCQKDAKIAVLSCRKGTVITVINYDKWQGPTKGPSKGPTKGPSQEQSQTVMAPSEGPTKGPSKGPTKGPQSIKGVKYQRCKVSEKSCADGTEAGASPFDDVLEVIKQPQTRAIQTTSAPYLLASWFFSSRGIPARPTDADMHYCKQLLAFYPEATIKGGIQWRLSHDPDGYWTKHITLAAAYRNFGNWMAESSAKALSLSQWIEQNPAFDYHRFTTELAAADGFMRAFNEAKRNPLVYFEDEDYTMYKKAIRIKTRESKAEVKGGV